MTKYSTILQVLQQKDKELLQFYESTYGAVPGVQNTEGKLSIVLAKLEITAEALTLVLQKLSETEK